MVQVSIVVIGLCLIGQEWHIHEPWIRHNVALELLLIEQGNRAGLAFVFSKVLLKIARVRVCALADLAGIQICVWT